MSMDERLLQELNMVRDAGTVERVLIANSWTSVEILEVPVSLEQVRSMKSKNRPSVIRGYGRDWKCVKKWGNPDLLLSQAKVEDSLHPNRKYTVYKPDPSGHLNQSHAAPFGNMTLFRYLSCAKANKLYLLGVPDKSGRGASPFEVKKGDSEQPLFAEDINSDTGIQEVIGVFHGAEAIRRHVFINSDYSFTNLHYDTDWNMYLCVMGVRTWNIAHPLQSPVLGAANGNASYSKLQPTRGIQGFSESRLGHLVKFIKVELFPGDVLFVPPTWWHVVEGMAGDFSGGINFFFTFDFIDTNSYLDTHWLARGDTLKELECSDGKTLGLGHGPDQHFQSLLHLVNNSNFPEAVLHWTNQINIGSSSETLDQVVSFCEEKCEDWKISRQLLCVVIKWCLSHDVQADGLECLCQEIVYAIEKRRTLGGSKNKRKRLAMN